MEEDRDLSDSPVTDDNVTIKKKSTAKRRSAVFKRQSILAAASLTDADLDRDNNQQEASKIDSDDDVTAKKIKLAASSTSSTSSFDLRKYIESLKEEALKWKQEYKKRKLKVKELEQEKKKQQPLDLSCLTDSQKAFLSDRPDYQVFNDNLFKLHDLAVQIAYLDQQNSHLADKSMTKLALKVGESSTRIIKLVD